MYLEARFWVKYEAPQEWKQPQKILRKFQAHRIGLLLFRLIVEVKSAIGADGRCWR